MQTKTEILIEATQQLAESIDSIDGIANAVIFEASQRLGELQTAIQTAHASVVLARNERDETRVEMQRLKRELAQAISERTPHDYGLLAGQRDDYRERLGAACKEIFELEAKVKLLTTERDGYFSEMERMQRGWNGANQEVLRLEDHIEDLKKAAITNLTAAVALVRPEPSRLEIAAMIMAGGVTGEYGRQALVYADMLIAAAKKPMKLS
jgi:chromosome segregation ATPase